MEEPFPASDTILCDGCGKPPRFDAASNVCIPLKQCSRCRSSWYHDTECQKGHYKEHKLTCGRPKKQNLCTETKNIAVVSPTKFSSIDGNTEGEEIYSIRTRPDGEQGVFACQTIEPIFDRWDPSTLVCCPLAPPVLFKTHRTSNCAICFRSLTGTKKSKSLCQDPRYPVLLCSEECRVQSKSWLPQETKIIEDMLRMDGNMLVISNAVYVYRLLKAVSPDVYMGMQSHLKILNSSSTGYEESIHKEIVTYMVTSMIQRTPFDASNLICVQQREHGWPHVHKAIHEVLHRLRLNGFTVVNEENIVTDAVGVGLYQNPSYRFNHSCHPNAAQSFVLSAGTSPQLNIEIVRHVPKHDEINICYIGDKAHLPVEHRRRELLHRYNFFCRCARCLAEE